LNLFIEQLYQLSASGQAPGQFGNPESQMALEKAGFISIPRGKQPGFDHADVYRREAPAASRLYVAHTGADRIDVIDCISNSYLRFLPEVPGVAGILIDNEQDLLFSSDRGCARVSIYRCSDEALLGRVPVGDRPNGLAYDPIRHRLFVFNIGDPPGVNCTISVVAVDQMRVIATIPLPGRPRWAVYDPATEHVYANIQKPAEIAVLDTADLQVIQAFEIPVSGPHGLALSGDRLFCAADGAALVALHRDTGALLGSIALPGEPDVIMQDSELARLYVAIGLPGVVSVIDEQRLETLEEVQTEVGAHTIGWNPDTRTLYAFLPQSGGAAVFVEQ
jgi:DNA-binding beta-propeller fold protein YncE